MARLRPLVKELTQLHPEVENPSEAIAAGMVLVNGIVVTNPTSLVRPGTSVTLRDERPLRGLLKLRPALDRFDVAVTDRVALDCGASAGGFVQALLERGVRKVYAVEVGYGQLVGSLRQSSRVANLERCNIAELGTTLVPDEVEIVTLDIGYLSLREAVPELERIRLSTDCDLVALVKPMFELRLPEAPSERETLDRALASASEHIEAAGWDVIDSMDSEVAGAGGAHELFVHARRGAAGPSRRVLNPRQTGRPIR